MTPRKNHWPIVFAVLILIALAAFNDVGCTPQISAEQYAAIKADAAALEETIAEHEAMVEAQRAEAEKIEDDEMKAAALAVIDKATAGLSSTHDALEKANELIAGAKVLEDGSVDVVGSIIPFIPPPYGTLGSLVLGALGIGRAAYNRRKHVQMIDAIQLAKRSSTEFDMSFKDDAISAALYQMGKANRKLVNAVTETGFVSPL